MKPDISIIIPFLNERESLEKLVEELNRYLAGLAPLKFEVIFVDDGSTDDSLRVLQEANHSSYAARIVKLARNYGSHSALRAGILHSRGEFTTFLPADLQDPLELIDMLYRKCREGYDIVFAYRKKTHYSFGTHFFSKIYASLMRIFVAGDFPESGVDIAMFTARIREGLNQDIETHSSIFLQLFTMGFAQAKVTYDKKKRLAGVSKWTFSKKIKMLIDSFVGFSYAPIHFVSLVGIVLSLLGFLGMVYIGVRAAVFHDLQSGWTSLAVILIFGFGLTNISLGIIAEYLWRVLDASKKRKPFIVDRIINFENKL